MSPQGRIKEYEARVLRPHKGSVIAMMEVSSPARGKSPQALSRRLLHDLRTPLNLIIGYSDLLIQQAQAGGQTAFVPDLGRVRAAGQTVLTLLNDSFEAVRSRAAGEAEYLAQKVPQPTPVPKIVTLGPAEGKVLVIDDNEATRELLTQQLEGQGYLVHAAMSGPEALRLLAKQDCDLVLLDIMMPAMDGFEVLERLKGDARLRHLPVIVISALSQLDSVARCIELGAEDYLPKPFNATLLTARVGASLEKKRSRDREVRLFQQLQQNYMRLQELERLRDDLTGMIIHDLRTPLTSIIAGLQSLASLGELSETQGEVLGIALTSSETLLKMINGLLDIEKLESGTMPLDFEPVPVRELVDSAVSQVASLAESKGLALVDAVPHDLPTLHCDAEKLRRTIVNLLGNAINFTPAGGTVTVGASVGEGSPSISFFVKDTGEGIPGDAFDRIFEKFGQVQERKAGRPVSTGLGLTFCKLAVEAHGGTIRVESTPGEGSTFSFSIPL